jgi:hypothetical protein
MPAGAIFLASTWVDQMLPAWMIDKIKKEEDRQRRIAERYVERPALDDDRIPRTDDDHRDRW